ncbi:MAG: hypothetical protein HY013_20760 [Candidatus Solibacter usitatus]|nr:hypothetical protein [Candidatus Solibacter usitatus]
MKLLAFLLAASLFGAALKVEDRHLLNGSFEAQKSVGGGGWNVVRGEASIDRKTAYDGKASLRIEAPEFTEARVESPALQLAIGKRYEIRAWIKTEQLEVRDTDRTPIAVGAALSMASLPFDYHSESLGGTRDWTQVRLRFVATRAEDRILCLAGLGGEARGRVWFDGVRIDEAAAEGEWPARQAIRTFGPAYRYPQGGWIYLHIEGAPYERGYQHGVLMHQEIARYLDRCALYLDPKSKERAWDHGRNSAAALFLRGFDQEILEEMKGIADGAAARGAKWGARPIDLVDVVAMNTITELSLLAAALPVTPTGLEGLGLRRPDYGQRPGDVPITERCSAFAATGPATRDGKMIVAHITMWPLTFAEQTNVMLDIRPAQGRRVLMQAYPGGIQSGTDYYQNDSGIVLTETTIRQSPFNVQGTPVAYRARKAIQYGTSVEEVAEHLNHRNNGMYTNEWLIGDAKTNHIAMFELGTYKTRLYRSSKNEWFGGTDGFYWGCNNAKDLNVRLEYAPDPKGQPVHLPFVPASRDIKWQELFDKHKGQIDEQFAFLAFRTAPLVSASSMDAKLATSDMASRLMCWAVFGKPNQREWVPNDWERQNYPHITGIYSSGYSLFSTEPPAALKNPPPAAPEPAKTAEKTSYKDRLWKGWVLPASDADIWFTAGSAAYYRALSQKDWDRELESHRAAYRAAALSQDLPLSQLKSGLRSYHWYDLAVHKGALLLDALRLEIGDKEFLSLMQRFFEEHSTKTIPAAEFIKASGKPDFFPRWLDNTGLPGDTSGPAYLPTLLRDRLASAMIVYGTVREAGANRRAAELLERRFLDWHESAVPVRKDFEASDADLRGHDVVFVGRPETNSALAGLSERLDLRYEGASFRIGPAGHASENEALVWAAANPLDRSRMVLVVAGNSALETVRAASAQLEHHPYTVFDLGQRAP